MPLINSMNTICHLVIVIVVPNLQWGSEKIEECDQDSQLNFQIQTQVYLKLQIIGNSYNIKTIDNQRKNKCYLIGGRWLQIPCPNVSCTLFMAKDLPEW